MTRSVRVLFGLFVASGFCGLIYQSIWSHYLKLLLGHAAYAQTVVLVVFIGGMAVGAWLAGRFAHRIRNPLWAYALAELLVGLAALVFHQVYVGVTDWAYASLLPVACQPDTWCLAQWSVAAALILPQSILLGTTFPFMTTGVLRLAPQTPGRRISLLYFLNSIGAVMGVLASGFVLIPQVGLPGALLTAGIGNVALAVVTYFVGKLNRNPLALGAAPMVDAAGAPAQSGAPGGPAPGGAPGGPAREYRLLLLIAGLTGLSSFVYEIVWIRMLALVLGSSTHAFELMLAAFILGLALGSLWIAQRIDRITDTVRFLAIVQVLMGVLAIATLPLYNWMFNLQAWLMAAVAPSENGYALFNLAALGLAALIMLPATICAGMTLPLITYRLMATGSGEKAVGYVYSVNTFGAILGVILTVHLGLPQLGLKGSLIVGGAIDVALGVVLLAALVAGGLRYRWNAAWSALGIVFTVGAMALFHLDPMKVASGVFRHGRPTVQPGTEFLYVRDGKAATVHVTRSPSSGVVAIATNGKVDGAANLTRSGSATETEATTDEHTMVLTGAIPLLYRPDAKNIAVIGFGTGISTATLLGSPNAVRVATIEIERAMVEGARHFLPLTKAAYEDQRSEIVFEDARSYFARGQRKYDLIVSEPSNPWVSGVAALFSEEFYRRIRGYLTDDGVLVQWVQVYETNPRLVASIVGALSKSFPAWQVYAANRGDLIIVAPRSGRLPQPSNAVFAMPEVKAWLDRIGVATPEQLAVRRIGTQADLGLYLQALRAAPNSDFFPIVDQNAPKARFMRASGEGVQGLTMMSVPVGELLNVEAAPVWLDKFSLRSPYFQELAQVYAQSIWAHFVKGEDMLEQMGPALINWMHLAKSAFIDCRGTGSERQDLLALFYLGYEMNAYLPRQQALEVWDRIIARKCVKPGSLADDWLRLHRAVAARDAAEMAKRGLALGKAVFTERTDLEREYVYLAVVGGSLASNRPEEAIGFHDAAWDRLPPLRRSTAGLLYVNELVSRARAATAASAVPPGGGASPPAGERK
ncbi:MAG: fused MFS/spermidine synthase [Betaproteobacteria bacterium]